MTHQSSDAITQQHEEFAQLFREHSAWLFNYLHSLLRDTADAEDALQETYHSCWKNFDQYDRSMGFHSWACKIAYSKAMLIFRARRKQRDLCSEQFFEAVSRKTAQMADRLDRRREALKQCLKHLPEKDRELINQRYTFDASVQELAEGQGRSVHAIYRALRRIHDMLLRCINRTTKEQDL